MFFFKLSFQGIELAKRLKNRFICLPQFVGIFELFVLNLLKEKNLESLKHRKDSALGIKAVAAVDNAFTIGDGIPVLIIIAGFIHDNMAFRR